MLFGWALFDYLSGPTLTYPDTGQGKRLVIDCQSLASYSGHTVYVVEDQGVMHATYDVVEGEVPPDSGSYDDTDLSSGGLVQDHWAVERGLNAQCDRARSERTAWIGLLAVPTAILWTMSFLAREPEERHWPGDARPRRQFRLFPRRERHWSEIETPK